MVDHRSARAILQRAITGAPVGADELERALDHAATCRECDLCFDLDDAAAFIESMKETPTVTHSPVDTALLFERALTTALSDRDPVTRRWAAERLGESERLGVAALAALVEAARDDAEERVRTAALTAIQRLDDRISLPQWVIDVWSAAPAEAAPYLSGVLQRLVGAEIATPGLTRLAEEGGVSARVEHEPDGLWLTVEGLSEAVEGTRPVVAVPEALEETTGAPVSWPTDKPGLVHAGEPVRQGKLRVRLGAVSEDAAPADASAAPSRLLERIYLLHPKERHP